MGLALEEARAAEAHGDVPIGAVVIGPDGVVLASAGNERELDADPTAHAEIVAIRRAADRLGQWRLEGCTLVVTLEPCTMCAGAIVASRIGLLVFGAFDPKAGAVSSLFDVVRDPRLNHRPAVVSGVRAEECGAVLDAFFSGRR
ncbi:MAG TPA: nucleoside deaminase [Propionibacteriaceae bacterium]|nr:nucleoside deaminase [Propionibacteriaceae bacterium]